MDKVLVIMQVYKVFLILLYLPLHRQVPSESLRFSFLLLVYLDLVTIVIVVVPILILRILLVLPMPLSPFLHHLVLMRCKLSLLRGLSPNLLRSL